MMRFLYPQSLLLIPVFLVLFVVFRKKNKPALFLFPNDEVLASVSKGVRGHFAKRVFWLRVASVVLGFFALARPQVSRMEPIRKEGMAIVLAIDCSSSMLAEELYGGLELFTREDIPRGVRSLSRMEAVRMVAKDFAALRTEDLLGVVAFAADAYLMCPLTFHHDWAISAIERVDVGLIRDATAIGSGIMTSLSTLRETRASTKVIVLLTDGINNYGRVPPLVAARAARALGVKIYTVGVVGGGAHPAGTGVTGRRPLGRVPIEVDEEELREIAEMTGGEYFRVEDLRSLREAYERIDRLERNPLEEPLYREYSEAFHIFAGAALLLLLLEMVLSGTIFMKIP